jgi:hypothetical protein
MINNRKKFWLCLSLVNLSLVAFFGFTLRSKILFPLPFIDFRHMLSAHSHFAFAGWVGLSLMTLLIYELLPEQVSSRKIYQWVLAGIETSSLGMAFTFPFVGYNAISIFFSTLYIVAVLVFAPVFIKDVTQWVTDKSVRVLTISGLSSLILSFSGTLGLVYILVTRTGNSLLYRDSIYVFLHFQYNGFFTLSVFALLMNYLNSKGIIAGAAARMFAIFLCASVLPAVFLSLLWHNNLIFYVAAGIGCVLIIASLFYFFSFIKKIREGHLFSSRLAKTLWFFSIFSFALKMILNVGTIFPTLGNAVYGDRPVIIGFLHLVFLGFVTFYILSTLVENTFFRKNNYAAIILFACGIFANESLLMLQGLGVLFQTNSYIYQWLLWIAAFILFTGAILMAISAVQSVLLNKKAITASVMANDFRKEV